MALSTTPLMAGAPTPTPPMRQALESSAGADAETADHDSGRVASDADADAADADALEVAAATDADTADREARERSA